MAHVHRPRGAAGLIGVVHGLTLRVALCKVVDGKSVNNHMHDVIDDDHEPGA